MAKTVRKTRRNATRKASGGKTNHRRRAEDKESSTTELEMKGGSLVVRISRDEHPEIFDINRLVKQTRKMIATYQRKRKMRDVVAFLVEQDKSLEIILKNHLEDAMRKYLK